MRYLTRFYFTSGGTESDFFYRQKLRCYDSYYPFGFLPQKGVEKLEPGDVTILYGGNGSGKTTLLNVMAEKLGASRMAAYNRTPFFEEYLKGCEAEIEKDPGICQIITSDDVFDYMLDVRMLNEGIDSKREERFQDFYKYQKSPKHFSSIDDLEEVRASLLANSKTKSQYVRRTLPDNVREYSNGESGYRYFVNNIKENGLYFLDEPENSLAPARQQDLAQFLEESVSITVSSSWRHIRPSFWRSAARGSSIWTPSRCACATGTSCPAFRSITISSPPVRPNSSRPKRTCAGKTRHWRTRGAAPRRTGACLPPGPVWRPSSGSGTFRKRILKRCSASCSRTGRPRRW